MNLRLIWVMLSCGLLAACAGTTVVLVPDAGGKVGEVDLTTKGGTTHLDKANDSAAADKAEQAPTKAVHLSDEKIKDMFAETLAKEPIPPARLRLYFSSGTDEFNAETQSEFDKVVAAIDLRKSCDMSVIGHSDTVGDNSSNKELSLKRADKVAKALIGLGVKKDCMDMRYYGENDPAVPTADNVDEPKNRRVEVEVR
ncbi:OmpA/MotB domain-containing protein [Methyloglobulus morosus KoM1]|uniref:OmpA/MotB domain-containing protein n=1 Tax=Methyloglobulus morosus KoM1 TaxID=1116472 RepID=V5C907_9GAMM|nr:OmpA family protein [Methyloglobulus morosus]ESS73233.1 OmpA/MotB domain-containing protein [Methyloglobulus morosus KoM1]